MKVNETVEQKYNKLFPRRLRELMSETSTSQSKLAEALGVTRQAVSGYSQGINVPDIDKLLIISDFFHVQPNYFLKEDEPRTFDVTVRAACELTNLNEKTITVLQLLSEDALFSEIPDIIDSIFTYEADTHGFCFDLIYCKEAYIKINQMIVSTLSSNSSCSLEALYSLKQSIYDGCSDSDGQPIFKSADHRELSEYRSRKALSDFYDFYKNDVKAEHKKHMKRLNEKIKMLEEGAASGND